VFEAVDIDVITDNLTFAIDASLNDPTPRTSML